MADVFVSYASSEKERARLVAESLEAAGFSVWWDRALKPGETFDKVIEREINAAKAVVVLWTRASVDSQWVREEADHAKQRENLVPVLMDEGVLPPMGFGRVQAAHLHDWDGDPKHHDWAEVVESVQALVGRQARPVFVRPKPKAPPGAKKRPPWLLIGAGTVIVFLIGMISLLVEGINTLTDPQALENAAQLKAAIEETAKAAEALPSSETAPAPPVQQTPMQPAPVAAPAAGDPYVAALAAINPAAGMLQQQARAQGLTYICVTGQGWCPMDQPIYPGNACWCPSGYGPVTGLTQ